MENIPPTLNINHTSSSSIQLVNGIALNSYPILDYTITSTVSSSVPVYPSSLFVYFTPLHLDIFTLTTMPMYTIFLNQIVNSTPGVFHQVLDFSSTSTVFNYSSNYQQFYNCNYSTNFLQNHRQLLHQYQQQNLRHRNYSKPIMTSSVMNNTTNSGKHIANKRNLKYTNNILYKTELCLDFSTHQCCPRGEFVNLHMVHGS
ncbi:unnamed protein product [Heterobilharzia americana]|nr:unnamed protein product [Heterobilharzia americana]